MLAADQHEVLYLLSTMNRIVKTAEFNGRILLDCSIGANGASVGNNIRFVNAETWTEASQMEGYEVDITQVATQRHIRGSAPLTVQNIGEGVKILLSERGRNVYVDTRFGKVKENIEEVLSNYKQDP